MISGEKPDRYAGIRKCCHSALETRMPPRYGVPVVEPEIEEIAQQEYDPCVGGNRMQPVHHAPFADHLAFPGAHPHTKVKIRSEIRFFAYGQR